MQPNHSRVFTNGNSQAVRIPASLRLDALDVEISKNEFGDLVIRPLLTKQKRGDALLAALAGFDADFISAVEAARSAQLPMQEREAL